MGRKSDRVCSICKCTKSYVWRQPVKGKFTCRLCSVCPSTSGSKNNVGNQTTRTRSSRGRQLKAKEINTEKSRRSIFKKNPPQKSPIMKAKFSTLDNVIHRQHIFQIGDIVEMEDLYAKKRYGQIQGIVCDASGEKSASLIWLEKRKADVEISHPDDFIYDKDEERLRKLDCLKFVIHAPSKYYKKYWQLTKYLTFEKMVTRSAHRNMILKNANSDKQHISNNSSKNTAEMDITEGMTTKIVENGICNNETVENICSKDSNNSVVENGTTSGELNDKIEKNNISDEIIHKVNTEIVDKKSDDTSLKVVTSSENMSICNEAKVMV